MILTPNDQDALDEKHLANPQLGDYWHETYMPICVVLARTENVITICEKTKDAHDGTWTWDLDRVKNVELDMLANRFHYGQIPGTWCHVIPRAHQWVSCIYIKKLGEI